MLLGVAAFILPLLLDRRGTELALGGFSTGIGILFALVLSVSCFLCNLKNTARDKMFFAMVALTELQLFFMELYSAGYGTEQLRRMTEWVIPLSNAIDVALYLLFWFYQRDVLPRSRRTRPFTVIAVALGAVYFAGGLVNHVTGWFYFVGEDNTIVYRFPYFNIIMGAAFELLYLVYVSLADAPRRKKRVLASYAIFPALYVVICVFYFLSDWSAYYLAAPYLFLLLALYLVFFNVFLEDKATLLLREKRIAESERERGTRAIITLPGRSL